jgi:hypothetical protein
MDRWSVHAAGLIGILHTINIFNKVASERRRLTGEQVRLATILSDIPRDESREDMIGPWPTGSGEEGAILVKAERLLL